MEFTYLIGIINRKANAGYGARIFVKITASDAIVAKRKALANYAYRGYTEIDSIKMLSAK